MPKKKPPKPKPKPGLTQKERFLEAAKKSEADESGAEFERAMKKVLAPTIKRTQD